MQKLQNVHFVGYLIMNTSCEFYYDKAAFPHKVSLKQQCSVICFRWAKELGANFVQSEMHPSVTSVL